MTDRSEPGGRPTSKPPGATRGRGRRISVSAIWLLIGILVAFHPALRLGWKAPLEHYPDTRLVVFVLEHGHRCLSAEDPWHCAWRIPYFHPSSISGALTETLVGILPFYSPFRWLGRDPFSAALLAQLLQSIALFVLSVRLLRVGLDATPSEAGFGAFLIAFGSPKIAQIYHPQLFAQAPLALALTLIQSPLRLRGDPSLKLRVGLFVGLLLAWQVYSCLYVGALSAVLIATSLPAIFLLSAERSRIATCLWSGSTAIVAASAVAVSLSWPAALRYIAASESIVRPRASEASTLLPPALALLNQGDRSLVGSGFARWTGIPSEPFSWEHSLGLGFTVTALFLVGAPVALRTTWLRVLLIGSVAAWLLIVRWPGGFSFWGLLLERAPSLGFLRAMSRLQLLTLPIFAATALLGLRKARSLTSGLFATVLVAAAVTEQARDWGAREPPAPISVEQVVVALPPECSAFYLSTVGEGPHSRSTHLTAMWAALESGIPTLNGYSGYRPAGWRLGVANEKDNQGGELSSRILEWSRISGLDETVCWLRVDSSTGAVHLRRVESSRVALP